MSLSTLFLVMPCILGSERYGMIGYEALQSYPIVEISELRDDLRAAGSLSQGTFGPKRAATWRGGELVLDVSTWSSSRGVALEGNEALWGLADLGSSTRAFRIDFGGTITDTWLVPSNPSFTHLVGGIDGAAVVCNSEGSGSSEWTARHCRQDGSVATITGSTGSMYPEAVGRLSDGSAVAIGSMYVGTEYHAFLWYFDDGEPAIDLHELIGLDVSSMAQLIDQDGRVHIMTRDADYQWHVVVYDPVTGELLDGASITAISGLYMNTNTGDASGVHFPDGDLVAWRSMEAGTVDEVTMADSIVGLLTARIDTSGSVLVNALLLEPSYANAVLVWPADGRDPIDLQDRTVGTLPSGPLSIMTTSPGGHAVLNTNEGMQLLLKLSPGDVDGDGTVAVNDLLSLLKAWGPWDGPCGPDLNFDGSVNVDDVLLLLAEWSI